MNRRRRGRKHGAAMMVWLFFAKLFDPKKAEAVEHIAQQKRIGAESWRAAKTAAAPKDES